MIDWGDVAQKDQTDDDWELYITNAMQMKGRGVCVGVGGGYQTNNTNL